MIVERNHPLKQLNTFGVEAFAQFFVRVTSPDELRKVYRNDEFRPLPKLVIGGGSNVLLTKNFRGLVIKMDIPGIQVESESDENVLISAGAGENWHQLVLWTVEKGYGGIENLSLIPGTVGAAPMQNIGAYGVELKDVFHSLEAYNIGSGEIERFYKEDCSFGYRYSIFKGKVKDKYVITRVYLRLSKRPILNTSYGDIRELLDSKGISKPTIRDVSQAVIDIRQSKLPDPLVLGNAGSFFKNPIIPNEQFEKLKAEYPEIKGYPAGTEGTKVAAGWLIERAGWKGKNIGQAGVHARQALVLVNLGGALGGEIVALADQIQDSVEKMFGIELNREVNVY